MHLYSGLLGPALKGFLDLVTIQLNANFHVNTFQAFGNTYLPYKISSKDENRFGPQECPIA